MTYTWILNCQLNEKDNFTRQHELKESEYVEFVNKDHIDVIKKLKNKSGKDIRLFGGGQINSLIFNERLIDEIRVFIMPIVIPDGIELFEKSPLDADLELTGTKSYSTGSVELKYQPK